MTSRSACDEVLRLYQSVSGSTWLPMYDMDFWIIPYLRGRGMTLDQILSFLTFGNRLLDDALSEDATLVPPVRAEVERGLRHLSSSLVLQ